MLDFDTITSCKNRIAALQAAKTTVTKLYGYEGADSIALQRTAAKCEGFSCSSMGALKKGITQLNKGNVAHIDAMLNKINQAITSQSNKLDELNKEEK